MAYPANDSWDEFLDPLSRAMLTISDADEITGLLQRLLDTTRQLIQAQYVAVKILETGEISNDLSTVVWTRRSRLFCRTHR